MELIGGHKVLLLDSRPDSVALAKDFAITKTKNNNHDAFLVFNLDNVFDRLDLWKRELPMIEPFYAVKCNTDKVLMRTLAALGVGFDCASRKEIKTLLEMGVSPDRIIYANTCKGSDFIAYARDCNVNLMTFDSKEELTKIHHINPDAEMILRIAVSDPTASVKLNEKFGAEPEKEAPLLLKMAQKLGVKVVGISFHVGTGCQDPSAYRDGIRYAKELCEFGEGLGFDINIIDIGGGFPGASYQFSFEKIADVIRRALDDFLPDNKTIRLIAEPGRYFATDPVTLVTNVIHSREVPASRITENEEDTGTGMMYYLNDGAYGYFSGIFVDPIQQFDHRPLFPGKDESLFPSTIWGPTCDSLDCVVRNTMMRKLEIGEWLFYENIGAYTLTCASFFNDFEAPVPIYVISVESWDKIKSSAHI